MCAKDEVLFTQHLKQNFTKYSNCCPHLAREKGLLIASSKIELNWWVVVFGLKKNCMFIARNLWLYSWNLWFIFSSVWPSAVHNRFVKGRICKSLLELVEFSTKTQTGRDFCLLFISWGWRSAVGRSVLAGWAKEIAPKWQQTWLKRQRAPSTGSPEYWAHDQIAEQLQEHCNNEFRQQPKVCLMTTENGLHVTEDPN